MIIIYAKVSDLKPKADETLEWGRQAFGKETLEKWEKSMREEGFKREKLLLVDWRGCIIDGNIRYHLAKKIGIEYLPIDFNFLREDLESFVRTQGYKWTELSKLNSEEYKEFEERMLELAPNLRRTTEKESLNLITQLVRTILSKRKE